MVDTISAKELYLEISEQFSKYDYIDSNEAIILITQFLGLTKADILILNKSVQSNQRKQLLKMAEKRIGGYPLQYILGEWEFYGYPFKVGEGVLIPRQDTETLVDCVIENMVDVKSPRIIDLCSGTGCIGITLQKKLGNNNPQVYLLEKSQRAIEFIEKNLDLNNSNCNIIIDDVLDFKTKEEQFDVIVSNPPYLTKQDMQNLQKEVRFEPEMALYGLRDDGLLFYEQIAKQWKHKLKPNGLIAFEVGVNQHDAVECILKNEGYNFICKKADLCGIIRVVVARK